MIGPVAILKSATRDRVRVLVVGEEFSTKTGWSRTAPLKLSQNSMKRHRLVFVCFIHTVCTLIRV